MKVIKNAACWLQSPQQTVFLYSLYFLSRRKTHQSIYLPLRFHLHLHKSSNLFLHINWPMSFILLRISSQKSHDNHLSFSLPFDSFPLTVEGASFFFLKIAFFLTVMSFAFLLFSSFESADSEPFLWSPLAYFFFSVARAAFFFLASSLFFNAIYFATFSAFFIFIFF